MHREFFPLPSVGEISGLGCQTGIEIVEDKAAARARTGPKLVPLRRALFRPLLIVTKDEADKMLDILHQPSVQR